ncbi:hypothetical protein [Leptothoe sp. PORK10 BA2]|uniref:hypothetical protein n=1 Tax=Leptothoe sp. PORK10 BA2 TaxID=3110254 RepID=UPI002B1F941B|nr:hypothetical protein [Leptothoe sp. PORK10 BA2]MEA5464887.1 hypothetical protein [Leptothoe sp. PORK10 BA2]
MLVVAETGMLGSFPQLVAERFQDDCAVATAIYKGSAKQFFVQLAEQLDIPTTAPRYDRNGEVTGEKSITVDQLKEEILGNVRDGTLVLLPEANRLTKGLRYWFEDLMTSGRVRLCCFGSVNPGKDIFLKMLSVELELPSDAYIRLVMAAEAQRQGLTLTKNRLAELQPLAGRNPMLARKVVASERAGLNKQAKPEHTQYVVVMPIVIAALMAFGIVRFVGLGTSNQSLYIFGGTALVAGMTMKQLGQVRGARKRLGQ